MKLYVFCILIFYFTHSYGLLYPSVLDLLKTLQTKCTIVAQVSNFEIEKVRRNREISDDGKMDKFAFCMLQKFDIMRIDGSINQNSQQYILISDNPEQYHIADACKVLTGKNTNETARKIMNCFMKSDILVMDPRPLAV